MFELVPYSRKRNLTFYNPFDELEDMQRRFFGENAVRDFKTDIRDNGESYLLEAELPGFKKEDISVNLEGDTLTMLALSAAVPTAMNGYLLAKQMGGDAPLYAAAATVQTVAAVVTIPLVLYFSGQLAAG